MSEGSEAVKSTHIVSLKRAYFGRRKNRADRAARLVKKYVLRHFKDVEKVVIDPLLNKYLWSRGRERPPRKVAVEVRVDEENKVAKVFLRSARAAK